jgi:GAF domain-containing protein
MSSQAAQDQFSPEEALEFVALAEGALSVRTLDDLGQQLLPRLAQFMGAKDALLYLDDSRLHRPLFWHTGLPPMAAQAAQELCSKEPQNPGGPHTVELPGEEAAHLALFSLEAAGQRLGLLGLVQIEELGQAPPLKEKALPLVTQSLANLVERLECEKQIANLNTYLNVSSMIAQALDLKDVLEGVLYFCMDAVSAEAASVLLLDYEKTNFRFYSAEGPSKPVLLTATFPADQGLAGSVLQTQLSEVINDVQHDPRFYGKIDSDSGFQTRNMIVMPLTAGEEKIGVLEVLNKVGGEPFYEEERLLLTSIAEEIAFAIRNGKLFEVVVKSYCKQRQGETSCRGCKRPLGSWTPCVRYREASIEV